MAAAKIVTRFAPSPTGYLHLGHVKSALEGWQAARAAGGRFLLRLEDVDRARCRDDYAAAIIEDLAWLGLDWDGPVRRQSEHFDDYRAALDRLGGLGALYPCFCTRREIQAEIARAGGAPQSEAGPAYPGTCRRLDTAERRQKRHVGLDYALRLDMARALALTGALDWVEERGATPRRVCAEPAALGDVVLARKDTPASYHLAVTVDDAIQGVTLVTRGEGSGARNPCAPFAAGIARPADAALPPPSATGRRRRPAPRQARSRADDPGNALGRIVAGRNCSARVGGCRNALNRLAVGGAPAAGGPPQRAAERLVEEHFAGIAADRWPLDAGPGSRQMTNPRSSNWRSQAVSTMRSTGSKTPVSPGISSACGISTIPSGGTESWVPPASSTVVGASPSGAISRWQIMRHVPFTGLRGRARPGGLPVRGARLTRRQT